VKTLREARTERLLTLRDLAERAGVGFSSIHLIETGRSLPRLSMIRKLSEALGVEPGEIAEFSAAIAAAGQPSSRSRTTGATNAAVRSATDRATDPASAPTGA
jgi:transcriptional regulator with XRE-family HTH domain